MNRAGAPIHGISQSKGEFLVDLYVGDDLDNTFELTAEGVQRLTGETRRLCRLRLILSRPGAGAVDGGFVNPLGWRSR